MGKMINLCQIVQTATSVWYMENKSRIVQTATAEWYLQNKIACFLVSWTRGEKFRNII
jgi:hypothetical protein